MEFTKVGARAFAVLGVGTVLAFLLPLALAVIWIVRKKERVTTVLVGALTFLLFALLLEKPIQNALLFPAQMGLPEHALSRFIGAKPWLLAFLAALFPGVFEETGRLAAYKTLLKNRKNRETSISHGIGHGGFEVMMLLGATYATDIAYAVMINTGAFSAIVEQVAAQMPAQADALAATAEQIAAIRFADIGLGLLERVFAVSFHIGASILVFYACRERERFWLYPLAVILHTAMDFVAAMYSLGIGGVSVGAVELTLAAFGILTFCGAYFLLYRRDRGQEKG